MNKFAEVLGREVVEVEKLDLNQLEESIENPYKGTLEEIIELVQNDQLVGLYSGGNLIGLNMITNKSYLEDQILQRHFSRAYWGKPVMKWFEVAINLKEASINKVKVVRGDILVAAEDKVAFDLKGNELANTLNMDLISTEANELVLSGLAVDKMTERGLNRLANDIKALDDQPSEIEIELGSEDAELAEDNPKRYLKKKYQRCLARGTNPTLSRTETHIKISDIQWGRKLTLDEYNEFIDKYYNN